MGGMVQRLAQVPGRRRGRQQEEGRTLADKRDGDADLRHQGR
eukprot:gene31339-biopygen23767